MDRSQVEPNLSPLAGIVLGAIQVLAEKESFGIMEDVLILSELRRKAKFSDHIKSSRVIGEALSELGYRRMGYITVQGKSQWTYIKIPDASFTDKELEEFARYKIEEAKYQWRIKRKPRTKIVKTPSEVTNIRKAAARIVCMEREDKTVYLDFETQNDAFQFIKLMERYKRKKIIE